MKRLSQRQKRIFRSLGRCFCMGALILKVAKSKGETVRRGAVEVYISRKCSLCRLVFHENQIIEHVLAHHDPIARQVDQIESLAALMGGDNQAYAKACEQVMGWIPWSSSATEFFRRQVSKC